MNWLENFETLALFLVAVFEEAIENEEFRPTLWQGLIDS